MSSQFISDYPLPYIVFSMVSWYLFFLFFRLNLTYKPEKKWQILSILVVGFIISTQQALQNPEINTYLMSTITFIQYGLVARCYDGSNQKKLLSVFFGWAIICMLEAFSIHLCVIYFDTDIQGMAMNSGQLTVANALSKLLPLVLLAMYPYFFQFGKYKRDFLSLGQALGFFSIPCLSLVVVHYIHAVQLSENSKNDSVVISVCISLLVINVIFFWLFEAFSTTMKQHYEHKLLELQVSYYENLYHNVGEERTALSTLRHNIKNDLLSLKSSYTTGNMIGLEEELNRLLEDSSLENHRTSIIPIVDAVLGYKITQGKKLGVTIEHQQELSPELQVSNSHLANILGNALDNAIEYCCELEQVENRIVHLNMKKSANNLIITVSNPFEGEVEFLEDLPLSSKREKQSHGIGLRTIRSVTKELGGHFSVETENNTFTLKVVIYHCYP